MYFLMHNREMETRRKRERHTETDRKRQKDRETERGKKLMN